MKWFDKCRAELNFSERNENGIIYLYIPIEHLGRVENLYIDRIWHVRYWRDEISIFGCNFVFGTRTLFIIVYVLQIHVTKISLLRFWICIVWINFDIQNHLLIFILFYFLFNKYNVRCQTLQCFSFLSQWSLEGSWKRPRTPEL